MNPDASRPVFQSPKRFPTGYMRATVAAAMNGGMSRTTPVMAGRVTAPTSRQQAAPMVGKSGPQYIDDPPGYRVMGSNQAYEGKWAMICSTWRRLYNGSSLATIERTSVFPMPNTGSSRSRNAKTVKNATSPIMMYSCRFFRVVPVIRSTFLSPVCACMLINTSGRCLAPREGSLYRGPSSTKIRSRSSCRSGHRSSSTRAAPSSPCKPGHRRARSFRST